MGRSMASWQAASGGRWPGDPWAAALAQIPSVTRFEHRMAFTVKKQGAYLRQGGSLASVSIKQPLLQSFSLESKWLRHYQQHLQIPVAPT